MAMEYASQYMTGLGGNGIANARGESGLREWMRCEGGAAAMRSAESYQATTWNSGSSAEHMWKTTGMGSGAIPI